MIVTNNIRHFIDNQAFSGKMSQAQVKELYRLVQEIDKMTNTQQSEYYEVKRKAMRNES